MTPRGPNTQGPRTMEPRRVHYEDDIPRQSLTEMETRPTHIQEARISVTSRTPITPRDSVVTGQGKTVTTDGGGPVMETTTCQEEPMDITTTSGSDIYYGEYPDFILPLPGQPCISDVFLGNSNLHSDSGSPMSIL